MKITRVLTPIVSLRCPECRDQKFITFPCMLAALHKLANESPDAPARELLAKTQQCAECKTKMLFSGVTVSEKTMPTWSERREAKQIIRRHSWGL